MDDNVGDMTQQAKIQIDSPSGGVPANEWNITLTWFLFFFVITIFARVPRLNQRTDFYAVWFIGCHFRVIDFLEGQNYKKFPISPIFTPKHPQNGRE